MSSLDNAKEFFATRFRSTMIFMKQTQIYKSYEIRESYRDIYQELTNA